MYLDSDSVSCKAKLFLAINLVLILIALAPFVLAQPSVVLISPENNSYENNSSISFVCSASSS